MRTAPLLLALACRPVGVDTASAGVDTASAPEHLVLRGAEVVGLGVADVEIRAGRIVAVGPGADAPAVEDLSGTFLVPALIDSHVHFAYDPRSAAMLDRGVAGAVDWAAPERALSEDLAPMRIRWSGPMITAVGGYPTTSWGAGGYGLECADAAEARDAVQRLADAGVSVIKVPITGASQLDDEALAAVVDAAHARGLKVGVHALDAAGAERGARAGADLLVHVPVTSLADEQLDDFEAVIPTLSAFGSRVEALGNVRRLREAGVRVLYGTDFGNAREAGVSQPEIEAMLAAGMDGRAILEAATQAPAAYFGFDDLGAIAPGKAASLLVLDADPREDPLVLTRPRRVYIDGRRRR